MSDEEDDFDAAFGDAEDMDSASSGDGEESDTSSADAEGEEGEGGESDEEDFSKDWGELPDEPVKFGGKGKLVGILKKVGIGLAALALLGGLAFGGMKAWPMIQDMMSGSDSEDAETDDDEEVSEDSGKKKKKKKRKKKTRSRPEIDDSEGRPALPGSGGDDDPDETEFIDLVYGTVKVSVKGKGQLWIDGVNIGKTKKKMKIDVSVGTHRFLLSAGKKQLWLTGEIEDGQTYDLKFDLRKNKKSFEVAKSKGKKRRKKR